MPGHWKLVTINIQQFSVTIAKASDSLYSASGMGFPDPLTWGPAHVNSPFKATQPGVCRSSGFETFKAKMQTGRNPQRLSFSIVLLLTVVGLANQVHASAIGWGAGAVSQVLGWPGVLFMTRNLGPLHGSTWTSSFAPFRG